MKAHLVEPGPSSEARVDAGSGTLRPMPVAPEVQAFLTRLAEAGLPPAYEGTVAEARASLEAICAGGKRDPVDRVEDLEIEGPGGPLVLRVYRPALPGAAPALVYLHGGGWARGSIETHDAECRFFANAASCVVVSVEYRLAPEHPFPAAVDDSCAALAYVFQHAPRLGLDPARIAVGGDSAGGNLAAVCALFARDQGLGLCAQLLIYPATDFTFSQPSIDENAEGYFLERKSMEWYRDLYLQSDGDARDPRASPLLAPSLAGLAPAHILTAEFDPLRDDGEVYGQRLVAAGVAVTTHRFLGMIHGFAVSALGFDAGREALEEAADALRRAFA